jgi:hypothetical protein
VKGRADPLRELAARLAFTEEQAQAFRRALEARIVGVFAAEHEPLPDLAPVLDAIVARFAAARAQRIVRAIQGAVIKTAVAEVSLPNGLRELAEAAYVQFEAAATEVEDLVRAAHGADPASVLAYVEAHPLSVPAVAQFARLAARLVASKKASTSAASKNAKARDWVLRRWKAEGHKFPTKIDFAQDCAAALGAGTAEAGIKEVKVSAKQIADDWLPKGRAQRP